MTSKRKTILYIAASLDGYIAAPNDDLSFLDIANGSDEDYGYKSFYEDVDTIIMGRKTFDWVMTKLADYPHKDKETFIITRTEKPDIGSMRFYTGDLKELVSKLKSKSGANIFIDGGAGVAHALLKHRLIDEIIITFIPILLGDGIRLFKRGYIKQYLKLNECKSYDKGIVQVSYSVIKHPSSKNEYNNDELSIKA